MRAGQPSKSGPRSECSEQDGLQAKEEAPFSFVPAVALCLPSKRLSNGTPDCHEPRTNARADVRGDELALKRSRILRALCHLAS